MSLCDIKRQLSSVTVFPEGVSFLVPPAGVTADTFCLCRASACPVYLLLLEDNNNHVT